MSYMELQRQGEVSSFRLAIVTDSLEVNPDCNITITDLNRNNKNVKYKHFFNSGNGGITFKCTVVIKMGSHDFPKQLNELFVNNIPVAITTDAIDVPNGDYLITKNPSRKQTSGQYTRWELEFTTYNQLTLWKFKNDNAALKKALKLAKNDNNKKALSADEKKLNQCALNQLKYTKKRSNKECVKLLQKLLKKQGVYINGNIDGWFYTETTKAVTKFQKKTSALKATGKVDKKTLNKICGV